MQDWQKKKFARLYQQGDNGKALSLAEIAAKTHPELNHRHVMRALNSLGIDTSLSVAARQDILDGVTDRRDIFLSTRQAEALNRIGFPGLEKHLIKIFVVNAKGFDFEYLHPMEESKSVSVRLTAKAVKAIAGIKDLVAKNIGKKASTSTLIRFALEDAIANNYEDLAKPDLPPVEHNHFTPVGVSDRFCVALTPRIMEMIEQIKAPKGKYQEQELNGSSFIRDCIAKCDPATLLNFVETSSNAKSFLVGLTEIGSNKLNGITAGLKLTRSAAIVAAVNQVCALNLQQELWAYTMPELPPDEVDNSEDIAQKIRSVRDRLGLSRRQLSEAIDCNFNIIAKLELRNGAVSKQWRDRVVNFVTELDKA
jgi:hypothetical protein